jgi:methylenetetrahydrofolate dehydrogenase (NADP+) / methenyltetrahydrofolate cyclohydrolase
MNMGKSATLMNGDALARTLLVKTAEQAENFRSRTGRTPCLAVVLVGSDATTMGHAHLKKVRCDESGLKLRLVQVPGATPSSEVKSMAAQLSADPSVDGVFVQYPLPAHVDRRAVFDAIDPEKDVDGVTSHSLATAADGSPGFKACAASAIILLLDHYGVELEGRHVVIIGTSPSLALPIGMMMLVRRATVTFCRAETEDLRAIARCADVLVSAAGHPKLVRGEWLKPESVVIDAGYYGESVGDVDTAEAMHSASLICPAPGGVGPVTIAVLLHQTVVAAELRCPPEVASAH